MNVGLGQQCCKEASKAELEGKLSRQGYPGLGHHPFKEISCTVVCNILLLWHVAMQNIIAVIFHAKVFIIPMYGHSTSCVSVLYFMISNPVILQLGCLCCMYVLCNDVNLKAKTT